MTNIHSFGKGKKYMNPQKTLIDIQVKIHRVRGETNGDAWKTATRRRRCGDFPGPAPVTEPLAPENPCNDGLQVCRLQHLYRLLRT